MSNDFTPTKYHIEFGLSIACRELTRNLTYILKVSFLTNVIKRKQMLEMLDFSSQEIFEIIGQDFNKTAFYSPNIEWTILDNIMRRLTYYGGKRVMSMCDYVDVYNRHKPNLMKCITKYIDPTKHIRLDDISESNWKGMIYVLSTDPRFTDNDTPEETALMKRFWVNLNAKN